MYRTHQQKHPEWPKKAKDACGRHVRLTADLKTRGGTTFKKGEELLICYTYRGLFNLTTMDNPRGDVGWSRTIAGVRPCFLELLPL
jgi:hypothetical protein